MTYYLKYRPQTIDELDLAVIRDQLAAVLRSGRFPHAFLFSGPKGLGKTSAARILAKTINCELKAKSLKLKATIEPCNQCEACQSITKGTALDLIEIDAASNRGIDDIRALRETIKLAPSTLKYKVYIIDEVHMLTAEAFNALLKTLEEPPRHAVFILATTEPQKLPETIVSRCLHLKFKKPSLAEMRRSLRRVAEAEKIKIDEAGLDLIAGQADGSFRDAVKILEQLSFKSQKVSLKEIRDFLNLGGRFDSDQWLLLLIRRQTADCLRMLQRGLEEGLDLKRLLVQSLEKLRQLLLLKHKIVITENELPAEWVKQVKIEVLRAKEISALAELLDKAGRQLKEAVMPQLPLELAITEWGDSGMEPAGPPRRQTGTFPVPVKPISHISKNPLKTTLEDIKKNWEKILRALRPHNSSIEALLRSARPLKLEDGVLVIEAFYSFHREKLANGKCPTVIEKVLLEIFGEEIKIKCVLGEKRQVKKETGDILQEVEQIFK